MANDVLTLHIEVHQKSRNRLDSESIRKNIEKYLSTREEVVLDTLLSDNVLLPEIEYFRICCNSDEKYKVNLLTEKFTKEYHIYLAWQESPQMDTLSEENDVAPASLNWCIPNVAFEGLWESLVLETGLKEQLMSYVETTLLYSSRKVNAQIVHWNGVILLHGPPGTGKTSLCKALAHKLSIRLNSKYSTAQLIEINTHSLFSKWFSESAKLVLKMFTSVKEWLRCSTHFVCILIDEVESLAHMRQTNGVEPSDSIRVVNAVLTQIDQLQNYSNVLILATSNVAETIDVAFADRADLKLFVPYPSEWGAYEILRSCIEELKRCHLIEGNQNDLFEGVIFRKLCLSSKGCDGDVMTDVMERSKQLLQVSHLCIGLSGRTLRKIPFLTSTIFTNKQVPNLKEFLDTMALVVDKHKLENDKFYEGKKRKSGNSPH